MLCVIQIIACSHYCWYRSTCSHYCWYSLMTALNISEYKVAPCNALLCPVLTTYYECSDERLSNRNQQLSPSLISLQQWYVQSVGLACKFE